MEVAHAALKMKGVDSIGLEELDRRYLETIMTVFSGGPAGVQAIAHTMNLPSDNLEDEIEPYLLREGLLQRTPRGRMLTSKAYLHLGRTPPDPADRDNAQPGQQPGLL